MLQLIEYDIEGPDGTAMAGATQFEIWALRAHKIGETASHLSEICPSLGKEYPTAEDS